MTYQSIKNKVAQIEGVSARPMFGYECFSVGSKFFVGFSKKNDTQIIVRLSKPDQQNALRTIGIKPFSHGAKAGWIEINTAKSTPQNSMKWIKAGLKNAKNLTK
jgi:predicted DNA-binding protein (MmcQ/YjbR family)